MRHPSLRLIRNLWTPHRHLQRSVPALRRRPRQRRLHRKKNMWYDSGDGRGRVSDTSHGAPYRADTKETNYPATGKANQAERRQRRAGTARHSRKKRQCKPRHWRGRKEEGKEGFLNLHGARRAGLLILILIQRTFGHVDQSAVDGGRSGNASDWVF